MGSRQNPTSCPRLAPYQPLLMGFHLTQAYDARFCTAFAAIPRALFKLFDYCG
jgi:hypothetical protein